jgi:hypothetical protein
MYKRILLLLIFFASFLPNPANASVTIISSPAATTVTLTQKTITLVPPISNYAGSWTI